MKKFKYVLLASMVAMSMVGCGSSDSDGSSSSSNKKTTNSATAFVDVIQDGSPEVGEEIAIVKTSAGDIKIRFYPEEAPLAVENFKELAKTDYYDGVIFHRVIDNFMIQAGDPTGTGTGGTSYLGEKFEDQISPKLHFYRGALAMANSGPDTNGSQFFIVQNPEVNIDAIETIRHKINEDEEFKVVFKDNIEYKLLDIFPETVLEHYENNGGHIELEYIFGGVYTIFGQAFEGLDIVDAIAGVETNSSDKPLEDIVIFDVEIVEFEG